MAGFGQPDPFAFGAPWATQGGLAPEADPFAEGGPFRSWMEAQQANDPHASPPPLPAFAPMPPDEYVPPVISDPYGGDPPDISGAASAAAGAIPPPSISFADEPLDVVPPGPGPMPRETDPPSPVLDAYEDPAGAPGIIGRAIGKLGDVKLVGATQVEPDETLVDSLEGDDTAASENLRHKGLVDLYANDPQALAEAKIRQEALVTEERNKRVLEQAIKEREGLEADIAAHAAAKQKAQADRAAIEADARAMADGTPFQQYWSSKGTGAKIAGVISAVFGGLMSNKTGGRNSGLDAMTAEADADAANKWKSIQTRRELNGEASADADADLRTQMVLRAAGREQVYRMMEAELANLDPKGTLAIRTAEAVAEGRARDSAAMAQWQEEKYKRGVEEYKIDQKDREIALEANKAQDSSDLAWAKFKRQGMGGGGGLFGKNTRYTREQWASIPGIDANKLPEGVKLSYEEVDKILGLQGKVGQQGVDTKRDAKLGQELTAAERELRIGNTVPTVTKGEDGKTALKWDVLRNADGSEFLAPNAQRRGELEKTISSTTTSVRLIDDLLAMRKKYGWSPDLTKSPEWLGMKSTFGSLTMESKDAFGLGALAGPDVAQLQQVFGTGDPTEVRDPSEGLEKMRTNMLDRADTMLRGAQYTGKRFSIPKPTRAKIAPRDAEVDKAVSASSTGPFGDSAGLAALGAGVMGKPIATVTSPEDRKRLGLGLTAKQAEGVEALIAKVRDENSDAAAQALDEMATDAKTPPRVRRYAASALVKLATGGNAAAGRLYGDEDEYDASDAEGAE